MEKSYQCTYCEKNFSQNSNLRSHLRTHNDEKTYKCGHCIKAYTHSRKLIKHIQTHHGE